MNTVIPMGASQRKLMQADNELVEQSLGVGGLSILGIDDAADLGLLNIAGSKFGIPSFVETFLFGRRIGDKLSDAQAYVDNGMEAYLIPHYKQKAKDMRLMAYDLRQLRGGKRLHVVGGWREIEEAIFEGKEFRARDFARRLEQEAEIMEERGRVEED